MEGSKFSEQPIAFALQRAETVTRVEDVIRRLAKDAAISTRPSAKTG